METEPIPRASRAPRQAFTVAVVKPHPQLPNKRFEEFVEREIVHVARNWGGDAV
jgi:hypothetical protein